MTGACAPRYMFSPSLCLLLLACASYALMEVLRPGASFHLRSVLAGAAGTLILALWLAGTWLPTGASYPTAENNQVIRAAVETASTEAANADCAIIVDGSSVFTYAVDLETLKTELRRGGHRACVLSLKLLGGEHLEREWMARQLRQALPAATQRHLDTLPMLWVKELHWTYESHPARFVAINADSASMLAQCEPAVVGRMIKALHENWKEECRLDHLKSLEAWKAYPWKQSFAALRQGVFNAFHTGQMERYAGPACPPLFHVLGKPPLAPVTEPKPWWAQRPAVDDVMTPSGRYTERQWFKELLEKAPSTWPQRPGFNLVLATAMGQNKTVQTYAATLAAQGIEGRPLVLAARDETLRQQLDDPALWRDSLHLEHAGSLIYTRWLAARLHPLLEQVKAESGQREASL